MMQLKQDRGIIREPDRGMRNIPVDPLTDAEIAALEEEVWPICKRGYVNRFIKSGLMSDYDEISDIENEAYIFFRNILSKFDKSKCGVIAEYDVKGAKNPKTLGFYFRNYFNQRVNFAGEEARSEKRKRGIGPRNSSGTVMDISFDVKYNGNSFSEYEYEHEQTGEIFNALRSKSEDFKRFFYENYRVEMKQSELRERWGQQAYNKLKKELMNFKKDLRKQVSEKSI